MELPATLQTPLPQLHPSPSAWGHYLTACSFGSLLVSAPLLHYLGAHLFPREPPLRVTSLLCHAPTCVSSHGLIFELQVYITQL